MSLRSVKQAQLLLVLSLLFLVGCGVSAPDPDTPSITLDPALQAVADQLAEAAGPSAELARAGAAQFEQFVSQDNPLKALVDWLQVQPGVKTAHRSIDLTTVIATLENGEHIAIVTHGKDRPEWVQTPITAERVTHDDELESSFATPGAQAASKDDAARDNCDPKSFPASKKAVLVAMYQQDFGQDINKIADPLRRSGYTVDTFAIRSVAELARLREALSDCGVLYIATHGLVGKLSDGTYGNVISTEIPIDTESLASRRALFAELTALLGQDVGKLVRIIGTKRGPVIGLAPEFFARGTYANTFVFVDACYSDAGVGVASQGDSLVVVFVDARLRSAFLDHGAGAFVGWDAPISADISIKSAEGIFSGLVPPASGNNPIESISLSSKVVPVTPRRFVVDCQVTPPVCCWNVNLSYGPTGAEYREQHKPALDGAFSTGLLVGGDPGSQWKVIATTSVADNVDTVISVVIHNRPEIDGFQATLRWGLGGSSIANLNFYLSSNATANYSLVCNPSATGEITIDF